MIPGVGPWVGSFLFAFVLLALAATILTMFVPDRWEGAAAEVAALACAAAFALVIVVMVMGPDATP